MIRPGDVVGNYRLVRKIGEGGMGAVYEAVHTGIKTKRAAVKVLHARFTDHTEAIARFEREAEAAASVNHEGIIDIYDRGLSRDGAPYIVMEYLDGRPLSLELKPGPDPTSVGSLKTLDQDLTIYIACNVLSALAAVHRVGIVHRDLKPDNIFLISTGSDLPRVKLVDFGIARMVEVGDGTSDFTLTRTGAIMGTPYYMSPEQAFGFKDRVDSRADLWSLGVILYLCTTGRYPFDGENYNQLVARIVSDFMPAEPRVLEPEVDRALQHVILRAMCKDLDERYASAEEMLEDLRPLASATTLSTLGLFEGGPAKSSAEDPLVVPDEESDHSITKSTPDLEPLEATPPSIIKDDEDSSHSKRPAWPLLLGLGLFVLFGVGGFVAVAVSGFMTGVSGDPDQPMTNPTPPSVPGASRPPMAADTPPTLTKNSPPPPVELEDGIEVAREKTVRIRIEATPTNAELILDGQRISNPFDDVLPFRAGHGTLEARCDGYQTVVRDLALDEERQVNIQLQKSRGTENRSRPGAASGKVAQRPPSEAAGAPPEDSSGEEPPPSPEPAATPDTSGDPGHAARLGEIKRVRLP